MNFDYKDYQARGLKLLMLRITRPLCALYDYMEYKKWHKEHKKKKFQRMLNRKSSELFPQIEWKKEYFD